MRRQHPSFSSGFLPQDSNAVLSQPPLRVWKLLHQDVIVLTALAAAANVILGPAKEFCFHWRYCHEPEQAVLFLVSLAVRASAARCTCWRMWERGLVMGCERHQGLVASTFSLLKSAISWVVYMTDRRAFC